MILGAKEYFTYINKMMTAGATQAISSIICKKRHLLLKEMKYLNDSCFILCFREVDIIVKDIP